MNRRLNRIVEMISELVEIFEKVFPKCITENTENTQAQRYWGQNGSV